ncbi:FtsX-like permease family protein [Roseobacteraceae bacterium NS-SX3]
MIRAALAAVLSHWRRHPLQLAMLVAGLALATALWSAVQAINSEARASYDRAAEQLGVSGHDALVAEHGTIPVAQYVALRRAGWQLAPVLEGRWSTGEDSLDVMGIDFLSHPMVPALAAEEERAGRPPFDALRQPGRLFVHPATRPALDGVPGLPPVTETTHLPHEVILTDISLASRLLRQPGQVSQLIILPEQPMGLPPLADLAPGLQRISTGNGAATGVARLTGSFHLNLTAFGLLSFAVGLFIVQGTVSLGLEQRRGLIRTLRALGVPLAALSAVLVAELALTALAAGGLGLAAGYLIAAALLPDVNATLEGLYGAPSAGALSLRPSWVLSGLGMALAGTALASAQALLNIWRMPLLAAPAARARSQRSVRSHRFGALAGAGLLAGGVAAVLLFDGLLAGFAFLGGLMLGAALMLPLLLSLLVRLGTHLARSALAQWLWADMRIQLPAISLALMALLLALAANIGVGTMVSSFRLTFLGWMDQRLSAEVYVTTASDSQGAELAAWLQERGIRVLPIRWTGASYRGAPLRIYGVVEDETYRENWPMLAAFPDAWERVATGSAALVNEQLARRHGLKPGSGLQALPGWTVEVAGVYSDYGNPHGQAIVALPALLSRTPDVPNRRFGLRLPPEQAPAVMDEIRARFGLPPGSLIDQAGIKARSLAVFDRTFLVTGALNLLTLGVAGFAMLTSLLTAWNQRIPQLAPVWAMGVTRRRLAGFELLRSLLLAALTALLALPLGLALAWALLTIINVEAFGWRLPMYLFPLDWLRLFLLALLAAAVAAIIPARRLARLRPADLLGVFANER